MVFFPGAVWCGGPTRWNARGPESGRCKKSFFSVGFEPSTAPKILFILSTWKWWKQIMMFFWKPFCGYGTDFRWSAPSGKERNSTALYHSVQPQSGRSWKLGEHGGHWVDKPSSGGLCWHLLSNLLQHQCEATGLWSSENVFWWILVLLFTLQRFVQLLRFKETVLGMSLYFPAWLWQSQWGEHRALISTQSGTNLVVWLVKFVLVCVVPGPNPGEDGLVSVTLLILILILIFHSDWAPAVLQSPAVKEVLKEQDGRKGLIAAICAGTVCPCDHQVALHEHHHTCNKSRDKWWRST